MNPSNSHTAAWCLPGERQKKKNTKINKCYSHPDFQREWFNLEPGTRTDVKRGTIGPGFGHGVESVTVLQSLLPTGVWSSHNIQFVVKGADTCIRKQRWAKGGEKKQQPVLWSYWMDWPALQRFVLSSGTWTHSSASGSYRSPQLSSSECPFEPPITYSWPCQRQRRYAGLLHSFHWSTTQISGKNEGFTIRTAIWNRARGVRMGAMKLQRSSLGS